MSLDGTLAVAVRGRAVTFTITVKNAGTDPVDLVFPDAGVVDVAVSDDTGEVWRYTDEHFFAQVIDERRLDPGEELRTEVSWEDPIPGTYTAVGELRDGELTCETSARFEVPDPNE